MDKFIGNIVTKCIESQENFMFETVYPFCKEVTKCEISKEELTNALLFWRAITKEHKTNGDMIKAMFPEDYVKIYDRSVSSWWNAPYNARRRCI